MLLYEFLHLTYDEDQLLEFLLNHNVIRRKIICPKCKTDLFVRRKESSFVFRCTSDYYKIIRGRKRRRVKCNFVLSAFHGSWFSRSRLNIVKTCRFVAYFLFLRCPRQPFLREELQMSSQSVVDWTHFCRELLFQWLQNNDKQLGGPGIIVEIDEAKIGKRKYNKGRIIDGQWIFGGYERNSGRIFLVPVPDRTTSTLTAIIKDKIAPGTIIYSDSWKAYNSLNNMNYQHYTVNHTANFVDPNTGVHTQNIERMWRDMRAAIPKYGLSKQHYEHYLAEFIFKRMYKFSDRLDTFFNIMSQIYPLNENISSID